MAKTTADVDLRDVKRAFRALEPTLRKDIAFAVDAGCEDVVRLARQFVPVRYGFLRDFIVYEVNKRTGIGRVGIRDGKAPIPGSPRNAASYYPSVYGRFVHNGTKYIKGRPFMMQAAEAARGPVAGHVKRAVSQTAVDLHKQWIAAGGNKKKVA